MQMPSMKIPSMTQNIKLNVGAIVSTPSRPILFLFSPRILGSHFKRPLQYNFGENEFQTIHNCMHQDGTLSGKQLAMHPGMMNAIKPSGDSGIIMNTQAYSDKWSFMIVIDENTLPNTVVGFDVDKNKRTIYIGICSEEPISKMGVASATPEKFINPNSQLIITRTIGFRKTNQFGINGSSDNMTNQFDACVASFDQSIIGKGIDLFPVTAESAALNCEIPNEPLDPNMAGSSMVIPDHSSSLNVKKQIVLDSAQEIPMQHMANLFSNMVAGKNEMDFNQMRGRFADPALTIASAEVGYEQATHNAFAQSDNTFNQLLNDTPIGLTNYMTLDMLCNHFHPVVKPINVPSGIEGDVIPQHISSINNIFSSLVCACVPGYMNDIGLSLLSFAYNSPADAMRIFDATSPNVINQDVLRHRANAAVQIIKQELFPMLFNNGGPFEIIINCNINGVTDVRLVFLDRELIPDTAFYREETMLGGIVSPLIGDQRTLNNNAKQLKSLVSAVGVPIMHSNNGY